MNKEIYKVIVVGNSGVGKTSLTQKYVLDKFMENELNTIGVAYLTKNFINKKGINKIKKMCFWDTAGQERFFSIVQMYFKDCQGVVCVYDITNIKSLIDCEIWIKEAIKNIKDEKKEELNIPIFLLGNKNDVIESSEMKQHQYILQKEQIDSLVKYYETTYNVKHYKTSAKNGENLDEIFEELMSQMTPKIHEIEEIDYKPLKKNEWCCSIS